MRLVRLERQQSRVADDVRAALASLGRGSTVIGGIALVGVGSVTERPIEAVVLLPHGVIIVIGVDLPDPALRLEAPLGAAWKADGWPLIADDDAINPATEALDISQACEQRILSLVPGTAPVGTIVAVGPYVETVDQPAGDLAGPVRVLHPTPTTMLAATVSLATAHRPRSVDQVRALIRGLAPDAPEFSDDILVGEGFSRFTDDSPPESLWDSAPPVPEQAAAPAPGKAGPVAGSAVAGPPVAARSDGAGAGPAVWQTKTPASPDPAPAPSEGPTEPESAPVADSEDHGPTPASAGVPGRTEPALAPTEDSESTEPTLTSAANPDATEPTLAAAENPEPTKPTLAAAGVPGPTEPAPTSTANPEPTGSPAEEPAPEADLANSPEEPAAAAPAGPAHTRAENSGPAEPRLSPAASSGTPAAEADPAGSSALSADSERTEVLPSPPRDRARPGSAQQSDTERTENLAFPAEPGPAEPKPNPPRPVTLGQITLPPEPEPRAFPTPRPAPREASTSKTVRWLPLAAIGLLVALVVAAIAVATSGDDTVSAPTGPPTPATQPPPQSSTAPAQSLQFSLRAADHDQRCASHAFGDAQASLQQTSCSGVRRASYAATVDGRGAAVTVGIVEFPDAAQAAAFKTVADTPGGGGILDLASETGTWGATPAPRFENAAYTSKVEGTSVRLVQAVWAPGPSTPDDPGLARAAKAALDLPAQ
ncbi:hypothetical protein OG738_00200 [Amycolatopsis sp. NBC_01488]|uniref:hypothetical protein n=1 Tax=Amycolatopsis sp. NBC_01488 TaxID=2903563 RepID=UPI002E2C0953|nr:hypothetical protein [Amycolatopsis sp. NBC_01488]